MRQSVIFDAMQYATDSSGFLVAFRSFWLIFLSFPCPSRAAPDFPAQVTTASPLTELVAAILEAAVQVLLREGAHAFYHRRAWPSARRIVGSVYQYFPNKAAILFRLQADEWQQTTAMVRALLQDQQGAGAAPARTGACLPPQRIRGSPGETGLGRCRAALSRRARGPGDAP
jgi:hypothetical protein